MPIAAVQHGSAIEHPPSYASGHFKGVLCRPSLECPSERDGEALVAERRFDSESELLADGGELPTKTQAQRLASNNRQRGVCAAARSERGGAEADERLRRADTIVFGKVILK